MIRIIFSFGWALIKFGGEAVFLAYRLVIPAKGHDYYATFGKSAPVLSRFNEGFNLIGIAALPKKAAHAIVIGGSGVGKSSSTFVPSLLTMPLKKCTFFIHDPSHELAKAAGYLASQNVEIKILDFSDSKRSFGFNVIAKIRNEGDIRKLAGLLVQTTLRNKEPFWDSAAKLLLATIISLVLKLESPHQNLANTRRLIQMIGSSPKQVDELMAKYADDNTFQEYKNLLSYDSKILKGIIATAMSALEPFAGEEVQRITSSDTFDFKEARHKCLAVFIQTKTTEMQHSNGLISIFFEYLFQELLNEIPGSSDNSIYFLMDEFASGLKMPTFSDVLAVSRKFRVYFLIGIQDYHQLIDTYSEGIARTIMSNCYAHMYYPGMPQATAEMLSRTLGKYSWNDGKTRRVRNLLEPEELRMMPKNKALLIAGNHPPIYATLHPYYTQFRLRKRMNIPMPNISPTPLPPVTFIK